MEKLQLHVISTQIYDTHEDTQEKEVQATVGARDKAYYILFNESDEDDGTSIQNTLKIKDNVVTLKRSGRFKTNLSFDIHKPYTTLYQTPYNQMEITILTHSIEKEMGEGYITLKLHYQIFMQGQKISDNIYNIKSCRDIG